MRFAVLGLVLSQFIAASAWAGQAARVERMQGAASADGAALSQGATIDEGATIRTQAGTKIQLRFIDGGELILGENAVLRIAEYVYSDSAKTGKADLRIDQGAFLSTSGAVAKLPGRPLRVATPVASIGVRGTKFWGGSLDNPLDVLLLDGAVTVSTKAGAVDLIEPGDGTDVSGPDQPPSPVLKWKKARTERALDTVTFR